MSASAPNMTITDLCRRAGISRQAYYQACKRHRSRKADHKRVLEWVRAERAKHPRMGGRKLYRRLKPLMADEMIKMGRDKLFGLLRTEGLLVGPRRTQRPGKTNGAATRWTNKLAGTPIDGPHQAWVADITYLRTLEGFCYLALVSDKYSRRIVGWDVADSLELDGAKRALQQALEGKPDHTHPIHHSDRGSQYRSNAYVNTLVEEDCLVSMTEDEHCAENAQAERLNGILKDEYLLDQTFHNTSQARRAARQAITLYNTDRPHMSLNYNTPDRVHRAA